MHEEQGHLSSARVSVSRKKEPLVITSDLAVPPTIMGWERVLYPKGRRVKSVSEVVLVHEGDAVQIGRTFWRALRKLEDGFEQDQKHGLAHASGSRSYAFPLTCCPPVVTVTDRSGCHAIRARPMAGRVGRDRSDDRAAAQNG